MVGVVPDSYGSGLFDMPSYVIPDYIQDLEIEGIGDYVPPATIPTVYLSYNGYFYEILDLTAIGMSYAWTVYSQVDTLTTTTIAIATGNAQSYNSALNEVTTLIDSLPVNNPDDPFESDEDLGDDPFEIGPILPPIDLVDFDNLKPDNIGGGGGSTKPIFDLTASENLPYAYVGLATLAFLIIGGKL